MAPREEQHHNPLDDLESPFLNGEFFGDESESSWDAQLNLLEAESPFLRAFEGGSTPGVEHPLVSVGYGAETEADSRMADENFEVAWDTNLHELYDAPIESEIFGSNNMDAVANHLAMPFRWICRLDIEYEVTPWNSTRKLTGRGRGSGTLISPCHILTAAHNVTAYDPVGRNFLRATRIQATPAHDGTSRPPVATVDVEMSTVRVNRFWRPADRVDASGNSNAAGEVATNRYDYALLTLKRSIGQSTVAALGGPLGGPLGSWSQQGSGGSALFERVDPTILRSNPINVSGYGYDDCVVAARSARSKPGIPLGSQLTASGQLTLVLEGARPQYVGRSMSHNADTCGGQSGAPVWMQRDGKFYLVGIHTGGIGLTNGGRTNHAVRVTGEVITQVNDWMAQSPCPVSSAGAEREGPIEGEALYLGEEVGDAAEDFLLVEGEDDLEAIAEIEDDNEEYYNEEGPSYVDDEILVGEYEASDTRLSPESLTYRPEPSGEEEGPPESENFQNAYESFHDEEIETQLESSPGISPGIADALRNSNWTRALTLAIEEGWRDENKLTNLIFFARHPELAGGKLDPSQPNYTQLSREWLNTRDREVWPVIQKSAENTALAVRGEDVTASHRQFAGESGKRFKSLVQDAAKQVDLNPGLLASTLLAETGSRSSYLTKDKVSSYHIGVDDFYERRHAIARKVPAYTRIRWDRKQKPVEHLNDAKKPRMVKTIKFDSGLDALLASAVYLKYCEVRLREEATQLGGDFNKLPLVTRWALIRMGFNAGVGGATKRLAKALKGEDILVRKNLPRKAYQTERNATIHTARALYLSEWIFGVSIGPNIERELSSAEFFEEDEMIDEYTRIDSLEGAEVLETPNVEGVGLRFVEAESETMKDNLWTKGIDLEDYPLVSDVHMFMPGHADIAQSLLFETEGVRNSEPHLLRKVLTNGLRFETTIEGKPLEIYIPPGIPRSPYLPDRHPESQAYGALSRDKRAKVAATVDSIFKKETGIVRRLDPKNPKDRPWIRIWLTLRDIVMRVKAEGSTPPTRVWFTEPLPRSEFHRFEQAISALESKVLATQDPRRRRYLCWIEKLKNPSFDDRIIGWSKICPKTSGAIGAAFVVGPCDITQGLPVDQTKLEQSIRSVSDVETANSSLHFIRHMRSAIVVDFELTSLPLENFRRATDDAGRAIEKLDEWANSALGGSSAMPPAYRAIKDWIMKRQNDPKSLYSCF